jgi:hypothetical protein
MRGPDLSTLTDEQLAALGQQLVAEQDGAPEQPPEWWQYMMSNGGAVGRAGVGIARGVKDVIDTGAEGLAAIGDLWPGEQGFADAVRADNRGGMADYEQARGPDAGFDWWRLGGQVAGAAPIAGAAVTQAARVPGVARYLTATTPAPAAVEGALQVAPKLTMGARAAQGAIEGLAATGAVSATSDDPLIGSLGADGLQIGQLPTGAAFGAAAAPVLGLAGRAVAPAYNAAKDFVGRFSERATTALDDVSAIRKALETLGEVNLKPSDITVRIQQQGAPDGLQLDFSRLPGQVQRQLSAAGLSELTPQQLQRLADFEALGIKSYTLGDVTRSFADQQFEREVAKDVAAGGPVRDARLAQNQQLTDAATRFGAGLGGQADNAYDAGKSVAGALEGKRRQLDDVINAAYAAAREQAGEQAVVDLAPVMNAMRQRKGEFMAGDALGIARGVTQQLRDFGILNADNSLRPVSINEAENVRQFLNSISTSQNNRFVAPIKDAIDEAVMKTGRGGIFDDARFARQLKGMAFQEPALVEKLMAFTSRTDRAVDYENVAREIVGKSGLNDLKNLKNTLTSPVIGQRVDEGVEATGQQAWNDLRAHVFADALDSAFPTRAPNEAGARVFSGPAFKKALDKIGNDKIKVLFSEDERAMLGTLTRASIDLTTAVPGAVNNSGTSAALFNMVQRIYGTTKPQKQPGVVSTIAKGVVSAIPGGGRAVAVGEGLTATGRQAANDTLRAKQAQAAADPATALYDLYSRTNSVAGEAAVNRLLGRLVNPRTAALTPHRDNAGENELLRVDIAPVRR